LSIGTLQERIGVLVVGGSPQLHSGLREVTSQVKDIRWMEWAYHLEEALERVVSRPPQVLLLELRLPGIREYEMVRRLRQTSMPPAIIALTPTIDDNYLYLAISLGAAACLPLDTPPEFLVSTIRRVHQGEQPIQYTLLNNMHVASQVLQRLQELPPLPSTGQAPSSPLSKRELEIIKAIAQGYSNKEIAHLLNIQEQTVKNHVSSVLRKLDANDRAHAAVMALRNGWISLS